MQKHLIVSDPKVMLGKPVVAGTRLTVELILEKLAAGESAEEILDSYPSLEQEALLVVLALGAAAVHEQWQTKTQAAE